MFLPSLRPSFNRRLLVCAVALVLVSASASHFSRIEQVGAKSASASAAAPVFGPEAGKAFDFDGDGKADIGRWQAPSTQFLIKEIDGGGYLNYSLGGATALEAPGDYNGDGSFDACVFEASTGVWTYKTSPAGAAQTISGLGQTGDIPMAADYDADGMTDAAVFRPPTARFV